MTSMMAMTMAVMAMVAVTFRRLDGRDAQGRQNTGGEEETDGGEAHDDFPGERCLRRKLAPPKRWRKSGLRPSW